MLSVVTDDGTTQSGSLIDEIVREGARRMLAAALEAEVNQYVAELAAETDQRGRRLVVRNGHHQPRTVVTAAGARCSTSTAGRNLYPRPGTVSITFVPELCCESALRNNEICWERLFSSTN